MYLKDLNRLIKKVTNDWKYKVSFISMQLLTEQELFHTSFKSKAMLAILIIQRSKI